MHTLCSTKPRLPVTWFKTYIYLKKIHVSLIKILNTQSYADVVHTSNIKKKVNNYNSVCTSSLVLVEVVVFSL